VVTDPVGDASGFPDAVSISGRFWHGNLFLSATFKEGTMNRTNLGFMFGFDVDRNPNTGTQPPATFPLGAEGAVYFNAAANTNDAMLSSGPVFQRIKVNFGSNTLSLVIPLSSLGSSDGVMGFGFVVGVPNGTNSFFAYDTVPDSAENGPLSGLTSPIPELKIRRAGTAEIVSWDARATNYIFESSTDASPNAVWSAVTNEITVSNGEASVTDTSAAVRKFFRMRL
jgi:hypothetical protein